jgi:cytoskeleton protein RodZ
MAKNLWKSGRVARNDARQGESNPLPPPDPEFDGVGAVLRKRREERGEDLRYVAQILRIRYPYLKAIEDGHPDELPGPTYAVGFVRTYADHLGLESEKLVQQFKEEAAGLHARADLHFPAPLPEGKIPSGVVLVMAVVLAAVVYGAWIYLSSREQQVAEIVPQLPNRISEIIKGKPVAESPAGTATASAPPAAAMPPAPANPMGEKPNAMPQAEKPSAGSAAPSVASTASPAPAPAPAPTSETPAAGQGDVASSAPEAPSSGTIPQPPGTGTDTSESDVTPPPSVVASVPDASDSGSQGATGAESLSETDRTPPKVYGEENPKARVVIHAAADSWVEVRDSTTDELLLTRVLFKGDKYNVPDRGGLTLLTGNAGGLRIVVDGTDAPAIGPLGAVRRNVSLEPSALLAGNAVRPSSGGVGPTDSQTSDSGVQSQ